MSGKLALRRIPAEKRTRARASGRAVAFAALVFASAVSGTGISVADTIPQPLRADIQVRKVLSTFTQANTPSTRIAVTAAPGMDDSSVRRRELPSV